MEPNNQSSPTIIQLVGPSGSGKSFFANQFAETFGSAIISIDKIRWILFAHHTYSPDEEAVVSQVSNLMLEELLKTRKTFILDGGCNSRAARAKILSMAKRNKYRVLTVVVQTDDFTAKKRSLKRDSRNSTDQYNQSLTASQYESQLKLYEAPIVNSNAVVISGKHTYSTQSRMVLRKILTLRQEPAQTRGHSTSTVRLSGPFIQ